MKDEYKNSATRHKIYSQGNKLKLKLLLRNFKFL